MFDMATQSGPMTAEALLRLPRGTWRYELVNGELRRMTPAGHTHGKVAARVAARLGPFVEERRLGEVYAAETGFILAKSPDTVRAPDAAFVAAARLASMNLSAAGYFPGAPDFAFEVMSPSDTERELRAKVADWLAGGCLAVLVLDPTARTAELHRPTLPMQAFGPSEVVTVDDVLPGWILSLDEVFQ